MSFIKKIFRFSITIVFVCIASKASSQLISNAITPDATELDTLIKKIQVRKIFVTGNKKTKSYIISREMQIKEGDSIPVVLLKKRIDDARRFVYNTTLFNEVTVKVDTLSNDQIDITTEVKERWYIFPLPQFQLVDRSISDWINNHDADLERVNYGIKFVHYNLTGRRDQLRLTALNGFSRSLSFSYTQPYSNKALTEGFSISSGFVQTRELAFRTSYNNKLLVFRPGGFINKLWLLSAVYIKRQGVKNRYSLGITYSNLAVPDSIPTKYNPNFFNSTAARQHLFDFSFAYQYVDVDNIAYPLIGDNYFATVVKRGFGFNGGVNLLQFEAGASKYIHLRRGWYLSLLSAAKIKLPFEQAFINQRALGYGEVFLRGMENYVVDGVVYALAKNTLKKKIVSFKINLPIKSKTFNKIPVTIFAKTYSDIGYVYNKLQYDTYFNKRFLYTGGFGIDVLTVYDSSLKLEYSFNQLGENGLFLRFQTGF
ncbi:POTRA domain-containing protein [Ferruginibacter sp. SUN002]|uniref:POTRA domain-containing protein n=1 Tax=Ferruginibacter sp. SUN002 TaxID=2937789 RepID=UPI003D36DE85